MTPLGQRQSLVLRVMAERTGGKFCSYGDLRLFRSLERRGLVRLVGVDDELRAWELTEDGWRTSK
jgi:hypothetical protein